MNEHLLQYLWNYKIFTTTDFKDSEGNAVEILDFGTWNHDAGPDFLNAKIQTGNLIFVGNIELHVRTSDWILHGHSDDAAYHNIILHVVYDHNTDEEFLRKKNIPTLELKPYISPDVIQNFSTILEAHTFVPCERLFRKEHIPLLFSEKNLLKKLDEKAVQTEFQLQRHKNNYEAVLFHQMAYAFGLKVNADIFRSIAENTPYTIIRKISTNRVQLEALFFGTAGWLQDAPDKTVSEWKQEYEFLQNKFQLSPVTFSPKFLRLRPQNFPTLRLSQLAHLYSREKTLFSQIMHAESYCDLQKIFTDICASSYWDNHFTFGKTTADFHEKKLSESFIDLVLINVVLPFKYAYRRHLKENTTDDILSVYTEIKPEINHITKGWKSVGAEIRHALDSQSFIYLYTSFCLEKKCLNCSIGFQLLKHHDRTNIHQ